MLHHTVGNISAMKLLSIDVPTCVVQYPVQVTQLRDSALQSIEMLTHGWSTESTMLLCGSVHVLKPSNGKKYKRFGQRFKEGA